MNYIDQVESKSKGKGTAWRKGLGKTKIVKEKITTQNKKRSLSKAMLRYDCRGTMVINIGFDYDTTQITVSHLIHHPIYVDVVGNRVRVRAENSGAEIEKSDELNELDLDDLNQMEEKLESILRKTRAIKKKSLEESPGQKEVQLAKEMFSKTAELEKLVLELETSREGLKRDIQQVDGSAQIDG